MYCYKLSLINHTIDYYTDTHERSSEDIYQFSHTSVWIARLHLQLFLIGRQKNTTIVHFYEVSVELSTPNDENIVFLGTWFLRYSHKKQQPYQGDYQAEADFLEKHQLYRPADKNLLAIEQSWQHNRHQQIDIKQQLAELEKNFSDTLQLYAAELGILYFFIDEYPKAFQYLSTCPSPSLKNITYQIAFQLAYFGQNADYEYLRKYDSLYDNDRPFLS